MSEEARRKREAFFAANPDVAKMCDEIRRDNDEPGDGRALEKAREIRRWAAARCPYWAGADPDGDWPVLTKLDFIEHARELHADGGYEGPVHVASTSGSTGTPFRVEQDRAKRRRTIADLKVFGEYALYPSHERMLQLRSYNGRPLDRSVDERENIWRWDVSRLDDRALDDIVGFVEGWAPNTVFGYVSTLVALSRRVLSRGLAGSLGVRSVLVGAETLSDPDAALISRAFGCPVFDRYSNMEMGIYAQREWGGGGFRVNKSSYYVEVLREGSDEPAPEGEAGRIVVTDLYNRAFPMIRYDTGDLGTMVRDPRGERALGCVWGRRVDSVYDASGALINPHGVTNGMWGVEGVRQWQFAQTGPGEYEVRVLPDGEAAIDPDDIASRLGPVLGPAARINVRRVVGIPVLGSGKRKYIVNETGEGAGPRAGWACSR